LRHEVFLALGYSLVSGANEAINRQKGKIQDGRFPAAGLSFARETSHRFFLPKDEKLMHWFLPSSYRKTSLADCARIKCGKEKRGSPNLRV